MSCEDEIRRAIRAGGGRVTTQRTKILAALRHAPGHQTVEEIHDRVHAEDPHANISLSTVYRTLETLQRTGVVTTLDVGSGGAVYEWAEDDHHHLVCRACGHHQEVNLSGVRRLEAEIERRSGFRADIQHMGIEGLCAGCARREVAALGRARPSTEER